MDDIELKQFDQQRTEILYEQSLPTVTASFFAAIILLFILWDHVDNNRLAYWFGLFALLTGIRFYGVFSYTYSPTRISDQTLWLKRYILGAFISGVMWGITGFLFMSDANILYTGFVTLSVCGLVAGSIPSYSVYHSVYYSFNLPAIIPFLIFLIGNHTPEYYVLTVLMCFFIGFMFFIETRTQRFILNLIKLRFDTKNLMLHLEEKQQQTNTLTARWEHATNKHYSIQKEYTRAIARIEELEAQLDIK